MSKEVNPNEPVFYVTWFDNGIGDRDECHGYSALEQLIENLYFRRDHQGTILYDLKIDVVGF